MARCKHLAGPLPRHVPPIQNLALAALPMPSHFTALKSDSSLKGRYTSRKTAVATAAAAAVAADCRGSRSCRSCRCRSRFPVGLEIRPLGLPRRLLPPLVVRVVLVLALLKRVPTPLPLLLPLPLSPFFAGHSWAARCCRRCRAWPPCRWRTWR